MSGGRTIVAWRVRIAHRILALTAAIWLNRATGHPITRSLTAYTTNPVTQVLV